MGEVTKYLFIDKRLNPKRPNSAKSVKMYTICAHESVNTFKTWSPKMRITPDPYCSELSKRLYGLI